MGNPIYSGSATIDTAARGIVFSDGPQALPAEQWLETGRQQPAGSPWRTAYDALVTIAGGRTDPPALEAALAKVQAFANAATASERGAAARGILDLPIKDIDPSGALSGPAARLLDAMRPQLDGIARTAGAGRTEWSGALQAALAAPGAYAAFQGGLAIGVVDGAKSMVTDLAVLAGKAAQYRADRSPLGTLGDGGRALAQMAGLDTALPQAANDVIGALVPCAARGAPTHAALRDTGAAIATYARSVAANPAKLRDDVNSAISAQWSSVRADHAHAAAQGPEAAARWWGETVGRVGFEVAATFVPVAGQAGKVARGARLADEAATGLADLGRAAGKADDLVRPAIVAGRPQHYFDGAGTKGNWRTELNGRLAADADYHVNGYKFSTDARGRVSTVEGRLTLEKAERNIYQQSVVGRADRLPDDQGGHLIASIFNGPGEAVNLKAMNGAFNMTEFRSFERTLETALKDGKKVDVKIDIIHSGDSARPDKFMIEYHIDGIRTDATFKNHAGG